MAEYAVNTNQLRSNADKIAALQRELDSVAVRLGAMQLGSVLQIRASTALIGRVGDCKWAAAHQSDDLGRLARGLDSIAQLYDSTENNLKNPKTEEEARIQAANTPDNVLEYAAQSFKVTDLINWAGRKAMPFSVISAFISLGQGGDKAIPNFIKNLSYAVGTTSKAVTEYGKGGWGAGLKEFFGLSGNTSSGWSGGKWTGFGTSWDKFKSSIDPRGKTTAGKVGVFAKWTGYIMTGVTNVIDNVAEFGGDLSGRFFAETAIETGVDIGLSIAAGVAVAAALPATAPAIVVGAVGAGVVWAANEVCEYIFDGRDIGECVSDLICDTGERIGEAVGDAVENIGNAARDAGRSIANAVGSACEWVGGLFG